MKKGILLITLIILTAFLAGCGGGTSSSSAPPGVNTGIASIVRLLPLQYVAQTNSSLYFKARVLDGNGSPVSGVPVVFTNLSQKGTITAQGGVSVRSSSTVAYTDGYGYATMRLFSSEPGFITILAEVDSGTGKVRDRKTVYFTSSDTDIYLLPYLTLDVDSLPGNGIYNEESDFYLFENPYDDSAEILATVYNRWGTPAAGEPILWQVDQFEISADWSGNITTNTDGQAKILIKAIPLSLRETVTFFNIYASAPYVDGVGAANMISLFLNPVEISTTLSHLTASPSVVAPGGESTITAIIFLNTGEPVFDGLTVNFSVSPATDTDPDPCGYVTPFAQTTGGVAQATFTAPQVPGVCTITATVRGEVIGTVDVTVSPDLMVFPESQTINGVTGGTATYTIYGGIPPYTIFSDDPQFPPNPSSVTESGGTFTVTVDPATPDTTVTYTIVDSAMTSVTATLNIVTQVEELKIIPESQTISNPQVGDTATYTILGGVEPYAAYSDNPSLVSVNVSGSTLTATVEAVPTKNTTVTITVYDAFGSSATATLVLKVETTIEVIPSQVSVVGIKNPDTDPTDDILFTIYGGTAPYEVISDYQNIIPNQTVSGNTFTIDPDSVATATTVLLTVVDAFGNSTTVTVIVNPTDFFIMPQNVTINVGDSVTFTVFGGNPPFQIFVDLPSAVQITYTGGSSFTAEGLATGTVTITVLDTTDWRQTTATLNIQ
jgi:plastocyanin